MKELERLPEKSIRYDVDALVLYEPDVDVVRLCQAVESLRRQDCACGWRKLCRRICVTAICTGMTDVFPWKRTGKMPFRRMERRARDVKHSTAKGKTGRSGV